MKLSFDLVWIKAKNEHIQEVLHMQWFSVGIIHLSASFALLSNRSAGLWARIRIINGYERNKK
jgi:hypothetical protein